MGRRGKEEKGRRNEGERERGRRGKGEKGRRNEGEREKGEKGRREEGGDGVKIGEFATHGSTC